MPVKGPHHRKRGGTPTTVPSLLTHAIQSRQPHAVETVEEQSRESRRTGRSSVTSAASRSANDLIEASISGLCTTRSVRSPAHTVLPLLGRKEICTSFDYSHRVYCSVMRIRRKSCGLTSNTQRLRLSFFVLVNRNKHIRALHEKSRPFKCPECGAQFAFQDGLSRHVAMVRAEPDMLCAIQYAIRVYAIYSI